MPLSIFGIRHHGPGCARRLLAALAELQPNVLVVEGPADAEDAVAHAAHADMKPPVAMLIYPPDTPRHAVYYPLAQFSPEWQAIRWALQQGVPVRLMDLPQSHQIAVEAAAEEAAEAAVEKNREEDKDKPLQKEDGMVAGPAVEEESTPPEAEPLPETVVPEGMNGFTWRTDPVAMLAEAAGFKDPELWWELQVERRENAVGLFEAICEAMRTVREETGEVTERDLLREAYMRKVLRAVVREGHERIAVVCGAWHAPVLDDAAVAGKRDGLKAKDDDARLKGLPKCKTATTWIPWTFSRLAHRSGYGAGVTSPGWYAHLWESPEQATMRWIITAARLLREKDLDASSASVIEAVRLADALAAIRDLRSPGLAELTEAILTVLCHGDAAPMRLIRQRLEIGDVLGAVPDETPAPPLARDLAEWQKRLRLKPSSEIRSLDLDLRKENDLARSHLFHRLGLLEIPWGELRQSGGRASTFHEVWQVQWQPEFAVAIIEANVWGNTVQAAAAARVIHDADQAADLPRITGLFDAAILAALDDAVEPLLARIQTQAAVASDVRHLLEAVLPLARVARYSDVRGTRADLVLPILIGMFERAVVGLPAACSALDDDAAARMLDSIGQTQQALDILNLPDLREEWQTRLRSLMQSNVHGLLRGWCCRLLLEKGILGEDELDRVARLSLSVVNPPAECAAWATGLLKGSGLPLLHQDGVWRVFDCWLSKLPSEAFSEMLPLLRRAFADFTHAERRQMGEKVKHLGGSVATAKRLRWDDAGEIDFDRGRLALPILAHILGVPYDGDQQ